MQTFASFTFPPRTRRRSPPPDHISQTTAPSILMKPIFGN